MIDYNLYLLEKSSTLYNVSFNYTKIPRFSPRSSGSQKSIRGREHITIIKLKKHKIKKVKVHCMYAFSYAIILQYGLQVFIFHIMIII